MNTYKCEANGIIFGSVGIVHANNMESATALFLERCKASGISKPGAVKVTPISEDKPRVVYFDNGDY